MLSFNQTAVRSGFSSASVAANVPLWLLGLPLALAFVSVLFIPIKLEDSGGQATTALKCLFAFVVFAEKAILLLFGHLGLRVLSGWQF